MSYGHFNGKRSIEANITDRVWLHQFHQGEISIKSGDWIETELETTFLHAAQQTSVQIHYAITHVYRVINPDSPSPTLPLLG